MNLSIFLAFGAMFGWGVGDFLIQRATRKIGAMETLFYITFASSFLFLPWVISHLSILTEKNIIFFITLGAISFVSGYLFMRALKIGKLAVIETITAIELPLTIALGCFFFKETLSRPQIIFILLLFIGVILISVDFKKINKRDFLEKGSIFALTTAIVVSLVNFLSAFGAKEIDPIMTLWASWVFCGLICGGFIYGQKNNEFLKKSLSNWRLILAVMIVDTLAWLFYVLATVKNQLSITISISESFIVVALLLGIIFNKEKISRPQFLGAILAISSSIIIAFIK